MKIAYGYITLSASDGLGSERVRSKVTENFVEGNYLCMVRRQHRVLSKLNWICQKIEV